MPYKRKHFAILPSTPLLDINYITIIEIAMTKLKKNSKVKGIITNTKILLFRFLIFPLMLYTGETWTLKQNNRIRINSFELCCWTRMLRIPSTANYISISTTLKEVHADQLHSGVVLYIIKQHINLKIDLSKMWIFVNTLKIKARLFVK